VSKVKKVAGIAGRRNVKRGKTTRARAPSAPRGKARPGTATAAPGSRRKRKVVVAQPAKAKRTRLAAANAARAAKAAAAAAAVQIAITRLDPRRKCGAGTTVQLLFRVDERSVDKRSTTHLVFFDRHGWYCEHGRTCPAVGHARKYNGQIARAS
jgi:hypothetical protein